jgi:predicted metal-dependent hydrolase
MATLKKTPALPVVRKLRFPLNKDRARNWTGRQALTDMFHGLSLMFPEGEKEFIESVRPFVARIDDPELRAQADAFTKQEAHHTREHARYNELLASLGYPVGELERDMKRKIRWAQKNMSPRTRLAFTVASEHFTAVLADAFLSNEMDWGGADETFAALWRWHAVEELEHKAVAFDVYDRTVSTYAHRVLVMAFVTVLFGHDIGSYGSAMMRADGVQPRSGWREIGKFFFSETKLGWRILGNYVKYYKPGFHPWDQDNRRFLERWNEEYDGLLTRLGIAA